MIIQNFVLNTMVTIIILFSNIIGQYSVKRQIVDKSESFEHIQTPKVVTTSFVYEESVKQPDWKTSRKKWVAEITDCYLHGLIESVQNSFQPLVLLSKNTSIFFLSPLEFREMFVKTVSNLYHSLFGHNEKHIYQYHPKRPKNWIAGTSSLCARSLTLIEKVTPCI